jgi:hypothetical protein
MGRLGVVAVPGGRWRAYAAPAAVLVVVTGTVAVVRNDLRSKHHAAPAASTAVHPAALTPPHRTVHRTYVVRSGDTIEAIARRTGVPQARILTLNPKVSPTALFIGQRLRLS